MVDISKEIDIDAAPDKVFAYLADFRRHHEWTTPGHNVVITPASDGPTAVGSHFDSVGHQMGEQRDKLEVTEFVPGSRLAYDATMKDGNSMRHTFELASSGRGTRLTKRYRSLKSNLTARLATPLQEIIMRRMMAGDVKRIKARMEQPAP